MERREYLRHAGRIFFFSFELVLCLYWADGSRGSVPLPRDRRHCAPVSHVAEKVAVRGSQPHRMGTPADHAASGSR